MTAISYIRVPRSLLQDPLWKGLSIKQQHIFYVLLEFAVFKPQKFDDFGVIILLEPGQFCASIREIQKLCSSEISKNDIERSLIKLKTCQFLRQEVRHRKTIITITHQETYELIKQASETNFETNLRQTRDKLETQKKNVNKAKKEKKIYLSDSIEYGLAIFLFSSIRNFLPDFKEPNYQAWCKQFDLLLRIDSRSVEDIRRYITWITFDGCWWQGKILSPEKLRKQWDTLTAQMKTAPKPSQKKYNFDERGTNPRKKFIYDMEEVS